jgi:hypothetical protein
MAFPLAGQRLAQALSRLINKRHNIAADMLDRENRSIPP